MDASCNVIYIYQKSMGPRTEPWVTPDVTTTEDDKMPFMATCCERPDRNEVNQFRIFPTTP